MPFFTRISVIFYILSSMALFSSNLHADELGTFGDRIFQFQEKLANRGNVLAQYKLGTLYEFGIAVPPNVQQASIWYKKAAKKNYQPAVNRLTYLEIIQSGYNPGKHDVWFAQLQELADSADANALILLGQMYHNGTHVETDLYSALDHLSQASSLGHTEVDSEIDVIKRKIENINQLKDAKKAEQKKAKKEKPKKVAKKAKPKKPAKPKAEKKDTKKQQAAEKRKRYEEAMRRLQQESKMLEEQQKWAEDN